jgi:transcriptional regulator with XRE-family HTH domain
MVLDPRLFVAARILAGLSQAALAKKADVAVSVVARFEQGKTQPRLDTLRAILGVLESYGVELLAESERHVGGIALVKGKWQGGGGERASLGGRKARPPRDDVLAIGTTSQRPIP